MSQKVRLITGSESDPVSRLLDAEVRYLGLHLGDERYEVRLAGAESVALEGTWDGDARHHTEVVLTPAAFRALPAADQAALRQAVHGKRRRPLYR